MRQKTFTVDLMEYPGIREYSSPYFTIKTAPWQIGEEVILVERYNTMTGKSKFMAYLHTGSGIPCNSDPTVRYYNRWCGTTNDVAVYAHGIRKIEAVLQIGETIKVRVGKNLHPELE